jgi:hypothetical protein
VERLLEHYKPPDQPESVRKELIKLMSQEARRHGADSLPHLPQ